MKLECIAVCLSISLAGCIETRADFVAANEIVITAQSRTLLNDNVGAEVIKQSAKATLAQGFRYFVVLGEGDASRQSTIVVPGQSTSNGTVAFSGSFASYNDTTSYTPPTLLGVVLPGEQIRIRMFKEGDAEASDPRIFDAKKILRR